MALPSSNDDFSLEDVKFSEPVKPQDKQARGTSCCVTMRKCIIFAVLISIMAAGLVMGLRLVMSLGSSQDNGKEPPTSAPTPAPRPVGTSITASLILSAGDAVSFARDERVKVPLAAAIASSLEGVSVEMVRIDSMVLQAVRRLSLRADRRLQLVAIRAAFSILTGSGDAMALAAASLRALTPESLTAAIMEEMGSAGLQHSVAVTSVEVDSDDTPLRAPGDSNLNGNQNQEQSYNTSSGAHTESDKLSADDHNDMLDGTRDSNKEGNRNHSGTRDKNWTDAANKDGKRDYKLDRNHSDTLDKNWTDDANKDGKGDYKWEGNHSGTRDNNRTDERDTHRHGDRDGEHRDTPDNRRRDDQDGGRDGPRNETAGVVDLSSDVVASTVEQQAVVASARAVHQVLASSANPADALGGIVRLAFHDAGTFDGSTGGADGCVDLAGVENRGLAPVIAMLEPIVSAAAGNLSRADVWVLAANVAIEFAGGPQLDFEAGRADASSCAGHSLRLPDAERGHLHMQDIFVSRLGFTEREVAALMGAHVLGRAEAANSGYSGAWVPRNDRFTNDYFRDLLQVRWNRREQPAFEGTARHQWNGRGNTMMLNTDIELAFDTSLGCTGAGGNGGGNSCPRATHGFSDAVSEFAGQGQQAFFQAFGPAWKKLAALGAGLVPLNCPFPDCATPGPFIATAGQMNQRQPPRGGRGREGQRP